MPLFRFIGDPKAHDPVWMEAHPGYVSSDPTSITMFKSGLDQGIKFVLHGHPVEVSDPVRVSRLRGNRHFEEVGAPELESGNGHSSGGEERLPGTNASDFESEAPVPKKRGRGRPKGSKNKNVGKRTAARPE